MSVKVEVPEIKREMGQFPAAYLITFTTYGTRLPGSERGWADRKGTSVFGADTNQPDPWLEDVSGAFRRRSALILSAELRDLVLDAIVEVCEFRHWDLLAAHVRSNHIHVVAAATVPPERILVDVKIRASYRLNLTGHDPRTWWARHGSTRYLWNSDSVDRAIQYVALQQGTPMSLYVRPGLLPGEPVPTDNPQSPEGH